MPVEPKKLSDQLTESLHKAYRQLLTRARQLDEYVVIADENGQPKRIKARDLPLPQKPE